MKVGWPQVLSWRVGQQMLGEPAGTAVDVARQLNGVQAQVMSAAETAIGIRTGRPPDHVRDALSSRDLVKTWAMRGTLHLLPADELPTWVAALRVKERSLKRGAAWERYHGLTVVQLATITEAVGQVLGAEPMTREELAAAVSAATGEDDLGDVVRKGFGGTVLKTAAADGNLCFGPDRGRNVTFVDARTWVGGRWKEPDPADASRLIVNRFLDAYGPATSADLARWWGVPPADGKRLLRPLATELEEVDLDGVAAYVTPAGAEALGAAAKTRLRGHVRLLPAFDDYVLAPHGHRRHAWPEGLHGRISRAAGWITPTLLVDGRISGVWAHERRGAAVHVEIEPLEIVTKRARTEAERQARLMEPLLGAPVTVSWKVSAG